MPYNNYTELPLGCDSAPPFPHINGTVDYSSLPHSVPPEPGLVAAPPVPVARSMVSLLHFAYESNSENANDPKHTTTAYASSTMGFRIKWIHFALGYAILLPWNAIITATPYFLSRLDESPFRSTFSSYTSTSYTAFKFLGLAYATYTSHLVSQSYRIRSSSIIITILTLLLALSTFFHIPPWYFFAFILINASLQAIAAGYLQTSVMAIGALFGPSVMQAVMSGEAAVAVIVSGVQVISATLAIQHPNAPSPQRNRVEDGKAEGDAAFIVLAFSTLFMIFTVGAHAHLASLPEYRATIPEKRRHKSVDDESAEEGERWGLISGTKKDEDENPWTEIARITRVNAPVNLAVALSFVSTLAIFPAITVFILPTNPDIHPLLFSAVHFFVFNVGDLMGRYICSYHRLVVWSQHVLLGISVARFIFIPLFMMCNLADSVDPIISSDILFMLILLACGASGGYVSTACMMSASSLEHNPRLEGRKEVVDVASTVASFFFTGGLVMGSLMSFAVRFALCRCNPFIE